MQPLRADASSLRSLGHSSGHELVALTALTELLSWPLPLCEVKAVVFGWAEHYFGPCANVGLVDALARTDGVAQPVERQDELHVERTPLGGTRFAIPVHGTSRRWMTFEISVSPDEISHAAAGMLLVAGRVVAASIARAPAPSARSAAGWVQGRLASATARAFLGGSAHARHVRSEIERLAGSDVPFVLVGRPGSGISLVMRLVHEGGMRGHEPLRVVPCSAFARDDIERALFGGAAGTAERALVGVLEEAGRGSLLFEDAHVLPPLLAARLSAASSSGYFVRGGGHESIALEARIAFAVRPSAEHVGLASDVLEIAPLDHRADDVTMIAHHMLHELAVARSRDVRELSAGAIDALRAHSWPGNVRELCNAIEYAVLLGEGPTLTEGDLPPSVRHPALALGAKRAQPAASLASVEEEAIRAALRQTRGSVSAAAALLGINRATLYRKLGRTGSTRTGSSGER